jgi:hypothetical protein
LHDRDIVGQGVGIVAGVVDDGAGGVRHTARVQQVGSDNNASVGSGTSNGAVSGRQSPTRVDDRTTAEMSVGARSQRHLVGELTGSGVGTSNNTALPLGKLTGQHCEPTTELVHHPPDNIHFPLTVGVRQGTQCNQHNQTNLRHVLYFNQQLNLHVFIYGPAPESISIYSTTNLINHDFCVCELDAIEKWQIQWTRYRTAIDNFTRCDSRSELGDKKFLKLSMVIPNRDSIFGRLL